jgi:hypothetical protein
MFQYASVYGLARIKGMSVGISANSMIYRAFHVTAIPLKSSSICAHAAKVPFAKSRRFEMFSFPNGSNVAIDAFLQSCKYFEQYKADIREQFRFKNIKYILFTVTD